MSPEIFHSATHENRYREPQCLENPVEEKDEGLYELEWSKTPEENPHN